MRIITSHGVGELIHTDDVFLRNDRPILRVAVNAWDLIGRKLEYLELDARAFERLRERNRRQQEAQDSDEQ